MSGRVVADVGIGPINIPTPGDVVTALKNAVVDVADAVFDKIIEWIAGLLADAVAKVTEALVTLLSAIRPSLTPGGGIEHATQIQQSVAGLAAMLVTIFYVLRIVHGLITGQAGANLRATLVDLPMVIVGTLFFGFLCYTLLSVVDAFSDPLISDYAATLNDTVGRLYSQDGIVQGGVFVIVFAVLYIIAAVFLCFELFVRSSLIYLVVMFAPLAIATRLWGPTRSYARRATEVAVALIFSKLAIAVTLATGASLMDGAADDSGNVAMIQGSAILLLAAFMPFALVRVIPLMEGAVAAEGVARSMGAKALGGAVVAGGGAQLAALGVSKIKTAGHNGTTALSSRQPSTSPASGASPGGSDPGGPSPAPSTPSAPVAPSSPAGGGARHAPSAPASGTAAGPSGSRPAPATPTAEASPATTAPKPTGPAAPSNTSSSGEQPQAAGDTTPTHGARAAGANGPRGLQTPPLRSRPTAAPRRGAGPSAASQAESAAAPPPTAPSSPPESTPLARSRTIARPTPPTPSTPTSHEEGRP